MLYLHIPYCHHKCTYCVFYSHACHAVEDDYVTALCKEIEQRKDELSSADPTRTGRYAPTTLYVGGGTPSMLSVAQLQRIIGCLHSSFDLSRLREATLECNPENLTPNYLHALHGLHCFSRLSIGVQSFNDGDLHRLNRVHTSSQAIVSLQEASRWGFDNLSVDLIYGLPGQSMETWRDNLEMVRQLPVCHLSCYSLSVEPGSMLQRQMAHGMVPPIDEVAALRQYDYLLSWASVYGFEQYEISSFAKAGHRSLHNSRYWTRVPYLGCGASAHSFVGRHRRWNVSDVRQYIAGVTGHAADGEGVPLYYKEEILTEADAYNEIVMLGLRTVDGIDKSAVPESMRARLVADLRPFLHVGMVEDTPTHYRPSKEGLLHADGISAQLFVCS